MGEGSLNFSTRQYSIGFAYFGMSILNLCCHSFHLM